MGLLGHRDGFARLHHIIATKILNREEALAFLTALREPQKLSTLLSLRGILLRKGDEDKVRFFLADFFAGEIVSIADQEEGSIPVATDVEPALPKDGSESVARSKLRIDTRRWLMEQFSPALYGAPKTAASAVGKGLMNAFRAKVYLPENGRS